jgi:hypothetical protein
MRISTFVTIRNLMAEALMALIFITLAVPATAWEIVENHEGHSKVFRSRTSRVSSITNTPTDYGLVAMEIGLWSTVTN